MAEPSSRIAARSREGRAGKNSKEEPNDPGIAAADWIAEEGGVGDIVVTADIPLAACCLAKGARVLDPKGRPFMENDIGSALTLRDLLDELRQSGVVTGCIDS